MLARDGSPSLRYVEGAVRWGMGILEEGLEIIAVPREETYVVESWFPSDFGSRRGLESRPGGTRLEVGRMV